MALDFIKRSGNKLIDPSGNPFLLKGVNLGSWLMMEGYITGGRNIPFSQFANRFEKNLGAGALSDLLNNFRLNFITQKDIINIANSGFNCIRLPFHYRIVGDRDKIPGKDFLWIEQVVQWAKECGIYIVLDMHGVPGCQNHDWHSDSAGEALFWENEECQEQFLELWAFLAERFNDEPAVVAYDIMNEPVIRGRDLSVLTDVYKKAIERLSSIDKNHLFIVEGNLWAREFHGLESLAQYPRVIFSIHFYDPLEFTFNLHHQSNYPGNINNGNWDKETLKNILSRYLKLSEDNKVPVFVGEFGVNFRSKDCCGELFWLKDCLDVFSDYNFSWTYWTYKAVSSQVFPNGIYQYLLNPKWVCREGPFFGWETWDKCWSSYKDEMIESWKTDAFKENLHILDLLKRYIQ